MGGHTSARPMVRLVWRGAKTCPFWFLRNILVASSNPTHLTGSKPTLDDAYLVRQGDFGKAAITPINAALRYGGIDLIYTHIDLWGASGSTYCTSPHPRTLTDRPPRSKVVKFHLLSFCNSKFMSEQSRPLPGGGGIANDISSLIEWFPGVCCNCRLLRARNGKKKVWINDHIDQIPIREFPTRLTTNHNRGLQYWQVGEETAVSIRMPYRDYTANFFLGCAADHRV